MKFLLTETSWILEDLDPVEWTFLDRIPAMAAGEGLSPDCRRRLLPDPVSGPKEEDYEEFLEDWNEFVRPDLESAFTAARDQVARDLAMAAVRTDFGEDGLVNGGRTPLRVEVDRNASEAWYSALNQARLLMNEAHDLADGIEQFRWPEAVPDPDGSEPPTAPDIDAERLLMLAQYEFYTALQSILIEIAMRGGATGELEESDDDEL